jgi:hypothetical protein
MIDDQESYRQEIISQGICLGKKKFSFRIALVKN